jgi:hypothetical protein
LFFSSSLPFSCLQAAFRTTTVVPPDADVIVAAMLFVQGFSMRRVTDLSRKLTCFFASVRNTLPIPRRPLPTPLHTASAPVVDERIELGDSRYERAPVG